MILNHNDRKPCLAMKSRWKPVAVPLSFHAVIFNLLEIPSSQRGLFSSYSSLLLLLSIGRWFLRLGSWRRSHSIGPTAQWSRIACGAPAAAAAARVWCVSRRRVGRWRRRASLWRWKRREELQVLLSDVGVSYSRRSSRSCSCSRL